MSSIELSDETLYKNGINVRKNYERLKKIEDDSRIDDELAKEELASFIGLLNPADVTYLFRLSTLNNGNKLNHLSEMILDCSHDDNITTYQYILDKEYLPYYRFFAKLGDYKSVATILEKRGLDDSQLLDFKEFFNSLDLNIKNELINDFSDGNYESLYVILAHN